MEIERDGAKRRPFFALLSYDKFIGEVYHIGENNAIIYIRTRDSC